jgi:hypothetical protein
VTTPAIAQYVTTYAAHTPYLTLAEWLAAPTAIDVSDLITGGSPAQQNQAVQDAIERASSWMDRICHQVLAATTDTHRGRYLVSRFGTVRIPLPRKPVLEVSAVSVGSTPSTMSTLTSLADVDISPYGVIEVRVTGTYPGPSGYWGGFRPIVGVTYVNGWPNTTLAVDAAAASSSVTVASSLGVYPGTALTIYDVTGGTEHVVVGPGFTAGSTTVPLVAPLVYAHTAGVSISNLPPVAKEAATLLTSALIQTRGDDAIVLESMDTPSKMSPAYGANADAERLAGVLLRDLVRLI